MLGVNYSEKLLEIGFKQKSLSTSSSQILDSSTHEFIIIILFFFKDNLKLLEIY